MYDVNHENQVLNALKLLYGTCTWNGLVSMYQVVDFASLMQGLRLWYVNEHPKYLYLVCNHTIHKGT